MKALCFVLLLAASTAVAQQRGSDGPRTLRLKSSILGMNADAESRWMLLRVPPVQKELGLTEQTVNELDQVFANVYAERGRLGSIQGTIELRKEIVTRLKGIITEQQQERLAQVFLQAAGVIAVLQPDVAEQLKLTDEQKAKLQELAGGYRRSAPHLERNAAGYRGVRLSAAQNEELAAVLTAEQKNQFEKLKGEKFDVSQLDERYQEFPKPNPPAMEANESTVKWEYKIVRGHDASEEELTKYGEAGWELVSVIALGDNRSNFQNARYYFKRPKQ